MKKLDDVLKLAHLLNGLPVLGCRNGSPAALAGVRYGDIVLSVNGAPTPDWPSYIEARSDGAEVMVLTFFRDGSESTVTLELGPSNQPIDAAGFVSEMIGNNGLPGMRLFPNASTGDNDSTPS